MKATKHLCVFRYAKHQAIVKTLWLVSAAVLSQRVRVRRASRVKQEHGRLRDPAPPTSHVLLSRSKQLSNACTPSNPTGDCDVPNICQQGQCVSPSCSASVTIKIWFFSSIYQRNNDVCLESHWIMCVWIHLHSRIMVILIYIFFICQAFMNLCFFSLAKILIILLVPPRERPQDHQCQQRVLPHNRVWETSKLLFFILFLMFFLYTFQLFFCSQCVNGMCQAPSSGVCSPTSPGGSCSNANERVIVAWCCVAEHVDNSERVCSVSMVLAKSVRWLQPLVNCLTMRVGSQSNVAVTALLRVLLRFLISRFDFRLSGTQQPRFVVAAEQCSMLVH